MTHLVRCGLSTFFKGCTVMYTSESQLSSSLSTVRHSCTAVMTWPHGTPFDWGPFFQTAVLCSPETHRHFLSFSRLFKDPLPPRKGHLIFLCVTEGRLFLPFTSPLPRVLGEWAFSFRALFPWQQNKDVALDDRSGTPSLKVSKSTCFQEKTKTKSKNIDIANLTLE